MPNMSADTIGNDILEQYRNISYKLKKRFFKKPNVTEACESFISLGQRCQNEEMPDYAGLCWIAAARCEGTLGNVQGEMSSLIRSGRQFLSAQLKCDRTGCVSPYSENLEAALGCYTHALNKSPEDSLLNIGVNLEIANALNKLNFHKYEESYLKNAVELVEQSLDTKVYCLRWLASNYIENGNYVYALESFTEITDLLNKNTLNGARSDILLHCEICRVLLLLILRPSPQKLAAKLEQLLEKYAWGDKNDSSIKVCGMSEKLFILLHSLVLTCQSLDNSAIPEIEGQLWPLLSSEQKILLRTLVKVYNY